jgi:hypothetical protein
MISVLSINFLRNSDHLGFDDYCSTAMFRRAIFSGKSLQIRRMPHANHNGLHNGARTRTDAYAIYCSMSHGKQDETIYLVTHLVYWIHNVNPKRIG